MFVANDFDLFGNQCPAPIRYGVACPLICVSTISSCPTNFKPITCPAGQTYCVDGQCKSDCSGSQPLCQCSKGYFPGLQLDNPQKPFYPCITSVYLINLKFINWSRHF